MSEVTASPDRYQMRILAALNRGKFHVYEGTVTKKEKNRRRSKNDRQKASRRKNW